MIFLESLTLSSSDLQMMSSNGFGGVASQIVGAMIVFILIGLGLYIYMSLAYSSIGKKAKITNPGISFLPFCGPIATIFESAKAHYWPFLVLVLGFFASIFLAMLSFTTSSLATIAGIIYLITIIIFAIMAIIWQWKTYKVIGKPGWFAIIPVIGVILGFILMFLSPILGAIILLLGALSHLILIGIAAWSN